MSRSALQGAQRTLVLGVCVAAALLLSEAASFTFVLPRMVEDFQASDAQASLLRQIPNVGALLIMFLAGVVGVRWGERRTLLLSAMVFSVGSLIIMVAPGAAVATVGVLGVNIGRTALFVIGLALISTSVTDTNARAAAFGAFGAILPVAYLLMPVLAGALIDSIGWRAVVATWFVLGVLAAIIIRQTVPTTRSAKTRGELITPTLAGVVLAAAVQAITTLSSAGFGLNFGIELAVGVAAMVGLAVAMRRLPKPSLSLVSLRHGGLLLILVVLLLTQFANLWFYMNLALQYVYGLTSLDTALILIPSQIVAVLAAAYAGRLVQRMGISAAGVIFMAGLGVSLLLSLVLTVGSALWIPAVVMMVYSFFVTGSGVPLTNAIMDASGAGQEGSASAFRNAANSVGSALGVALMTAIVFASMSTSLTDRATAAGASPNDAQTALAELRASASAEDLAAKYAIPLEEVSEIDSSIKGAYFDGMAAHGLVGGLVSFGAAGLFYFARRRQVKRTGILALGEVTDPAPGGSGRPT